MIARQPLPVRCVLRRTRVARAGARAISTAVTEVTTQHRTCSFCVTLKKWPSEDDRSPRQAVRRPPTQKDETLRATILLPEDSEIAGWLKITQENVRKPAFKALLSS